MSAPGVVILLLGVISVTAFGYVAYRAWVTGHRVLATLVAVVALLVGAAVWAAPVPTDTGVHSAGMGEQIVPNPCACRMVSVTVR